MEMTARRKFVKAVKMVIMNNTMSRATAEVEEDDTVSSFSIISDVTREVEELTFDKNYYKAVREVTLSKDIKHTLCSEIEDRTPKQLKESLAALQSIKSFTAFPNYMQGKLSQIIFYHDVPPKKTIFRQGHKSEYFYILLSGKALVTIMEKDPNTGEEYDRIVDVLKKGETFGEVAMVYHTPRQATITSIGPCQLLSIQREDYFEMFMTSELPDEDPPHIKFLRNLKLFKDWPVDVLCDDEAEECIFHYFKRGQVIIKDSNDSDWLYFIKSGSCQVIKRLRETKPLIRQRSAESEDVFQIPRNGAVFKSKIDNRWGRTKRIQSEPADTLRFSRATTRNDESREGWKFFSEIPKNYNNESYKEKEELSTSASLPLSPKSLTSSSSADCIHSFDVLKDKSRNSSVFVQLEILRSKDVFGLTSLCKEAGVYDQEQTSVSLVSRGAEMVMVRKAFFLQHANGTVLKRAQTLARPYLQEATLQQRLQDFVNWQSFKEGAIRDMISH